MKQPCIILFILFFTCSSIIAQTGTGSQFIKPANFHEKVSIIVSGKTRGYYSLSAAETSVVNVQGPGTLKIYTRGQFNPGEEDIINYVILYTIDGGEQQMMTANAIERSAVATYSDVTSGVPGELYTFETTLLRGHHTVEFKLQDSKVNVAARYIFTPAKIKKQEWVAFSPMLPSEPVDLISRESTTSYYRFSMEKPLKIEIIGPTELRILTRIEYKFQMKGRINYRVQVKENAGVLNTYQLNSKPSEIAVYKDEKEVVPGTACEFVIYVPKGKHMYEVLPLDKDKGTLLGRLLIPEKDIKLEN